jgi:hypothetical protein
MYDSRKLCAMKKTFETIHLAVACLALLLPLHLRAQQTGTVPECRSANCSLRGSQSAPSQGSSNSANRNQQIQNAIGAFGAAMEQSARQQAEREQRQAEEDARRQQAEQIRQNQINQQMQSAAARAQSDPVLNPFGNAPSGSFQPSAGSTPSGNPSASINPNDNFTGQPCRWFVVRDEESCSSRSCFYSEGQTVALGPRAYRCESGRWALIRDCNQAPLEHQKTACQSDIARTHGVPGAKETPAQRVYSQD